MIFCAASGMPVPSNGFASVPSNPLELTDDIIRLADSGEGARGRLCPHFHIPCKAVTTAS
jgi:hypothetical protein